MQEKATKQLKNISYSYGIGSLLLMWIFEANLMLPWEVYLSTLCHIIVGSIASTYHRWRNFSPIYKVMYFSAFFVALNTIIYFSPIGISVFLIHLHLFSITSMINSRGVYWMTSSYALGYFLIINYRQTFDDRSLLWSLVIITSFFLLTKITRLLLNSEQRANNFQAINGVLLSNTSAGIQLIDTEGKTQLMNKSCEKIYGISVEEAIGKYDVDLIYEGKKFDEDGNYTSRITETLETGKEYRNYEREVFDEYGFRKTYSIETFRVFDDERVFLGALGIYRDISNQKNLEQELKESNEHLVRLASTDELTRLYNYRYFINNLDYTVASATLNDENVSLIMLDVDFFKEYNDKFGHPAGDQILIEVAQIIKACVRSSDLVARYGGEEFAIILPKQNKERAKEVAERIRVHIANHYFKGQEQLEEKNLTVSLGVAVYPEIAKSAEELLKKADTALYGAKSSGRNNVGVYDEEKIKNIFEAV